MKRPIIILILILLLCFVIGRMETDNEVIVKNVKSIGIVNSNIVTKRILWVTLIILQSLLSYSLLKSSKKYLGLYKNLLLISSIIALLAVLVFIYVFIISVTSFWI
jgi:hypothetical protein